MTLADRVVVLEDGKIQQIGSPQAVYAQPVNRMVAGFLGNPSMNLIPATYQEGRLIILNQQSISLTPKMLQLLKSNPEDNFDIGIRPEHIQIVSSPNPDNLVVIVNVVEPLGRETLIKASPPESNITLNLLAPGNWQGKTGDRLTIQFDPTKLFIFDINSGKTVISNELEVTS